MLSDGAVAYVNVDIGMTGRDFEAAASPALAELIRRSAARVPAPTPADAAAGLSLLDVWWRSQNERGALDTNKANRTAVGALGSGSDFTPFLQHLGISSMDSGLSGPYGVYHSMFDDYKWMHDFGDPGWHSGVTMARFLGLVALQLADARILPFDHVETTEALVGFYTDIQMLSNAKRIRLPLHQLGWSIDVFSEAAFALESLIANAEHLSDAQLDDINDRLFKLERHFLSPDGLLDRPNSFYEHLIYAPGIYAGYEAEVFPGVAQALKNGNLELAASEALRLASHIEEAGRFLLGTSAW
jgi:N-acetylated-alpha-linked acidic dipeptidase